MKRESSRDLLAELNEEVSKLPTSAKKDGHLVKKDALGARCRMNDLTWLGKGKRPLTNIEIFRQIVKEKHLVSQMNCKSEYQKFCKKELSSGLRNGIVTRAFSRNKLEKFTRPDPNQLKISLKNRVDSIIQKTLVIQTGSLSKGSPYQKTVKASRTNDDSYGLLQLKKNMLNDSSRVSLMPSGGQRPVDLKLKDFPEEKKTIVQFQNRLKSAGNTKRGMKSRNSSLCLFSLNDESRLQRADFMPDHLKLQVRKDKQIVNSFNNSFTMSGRASHTRQHQSNSRDAV